MPERVRLVLASGSSARRAMLSRAGLAFEVVPADIDEAALAAGSGFSEAADIATLLAAEKARFVSLQVPEALVIGSDQVLALGRQKFSKARRREDARRTLRALKGQTHELVSAVALARSGDILWSAVDSAELTMRDFSEAFLEDYLARAGDGILGSVGCYEIEGLGVQLFDRIDGDFFTILGMPLMVLLEELRRKGLMAA